MIDDLNTGDFPGLRKSDICILGGGPAGLSLALRLAKRSPARTITVLEGGGRQFSNQAQWLYAGESVGHPYYPLQSTRLRQLGGTTGHWQGWCTPLSSHDFDQKDWIPHSGWPISKRDLAPYYSQAARFLDITPDRFSPADWPVYARHLHDWQGDLELMLWQFSRPPANVGELHYESLKQQKNLHVLLHANATSINTNASATRVEDVTVANLDGTRWHRFRAGLFVVACGGIENARLLLDSTQTSAHGVGNDRDVVGRYFNDHILTQTGKVHELSPQALATYTQAARHPGQALGLGFVPSRRLQQQHRIANAALYLLPPQAAPRNETLTAYRNLMNGQLFREAPAKVPAAVIGLARNLDTLITLTAIKLHGKRAVTVKQLEGIYTAWVLAEQRPQPDSRVMLSTSTNALGSRQTRLDWRLQEGDYQTVRRSAQLYGQSLLQNHLGRMQLSDWLRKEAIQWPDSPVCSNHPMGSTRMAENPERGVVDANCKVHGIDNLFIAGSSVFPTGGFANPTLTIVALAQRLADHLVQRYRLSVP